MQDEAPVASTTESSSSPGISFLSRRDIDRLTNYKWRYSLESHGFSTEQATRLLFARWLHRQGILQG